MKAECFCFLLKIIVCVRFIIQWMGQVVINSFYIIACHHIEIYSCVWQAAEIGVNSTVFDLHDLGLIFPIYGKMILMEMVLVYVMVVIKVWLLFKGAVNLISHNIYVGLSIKSFTFRLLKLYWTLPVNISFSPLVLLWSTGESPKCIFDFKGIIWVFALLLKKLCPDKTVMADWTLK